MHASAYLNTHSDEKIALPMPWPDEQRAAAVTPEEREQLKKRLLRHSAFAS